MELIESHKNNKTIRCVLLAAIIVSLYFVFFRLSYNQIAHGAQYPSDINDHIKFASNGTGYSILYTCLSMIIRITGNNYPKGIAAFEALLIILPVLPLSKWIKKNYKVFTFSALIVSMGLLFLSSIYWPVLFRSFYVGGIITQPWHNITYFGMRLFAVMAFYFFSESIASYQEQFSFLHWIKISVPLMIATWIKPNFFLAFSWTLLLFLFIDAIKGKWKTHVITNCIKLGTVVFPSLVILYLQSRLLYGVGSGGTNPSGIEFVFFSSRFFAKGFWYALIKLLRDLLFPLIVLAFSNKHKRLSRIEKFSYVLFFVALIQVICLQETGPRANHGNFYWTLFISSFLLFSTAVSHYISDFKTAVIEKANKPLSVKQIKKGYRVYLICGLGIMMMHLISGISYFVIVYKGGNYFI